LRIYNNLLPEDLRNEVVLWLVREGLL